jgi:hypothetical protein
LHTVWAKPRGREDLMQIKDRDLPGEPDWTVVEDVVDEPRSHRLGLGFRKGLGFTPSSIEDDETVSASIDFDPEPEKLEEKDRVGEDTHPRR